MPGAAWCDHPRLPTGAQSPTAAEDGEAGQCKVQLESPSWRNFVAHFEWEEWMGRIRMAGSQSRNSRSLKPSKLTPMGSGYAEFEEQEKGLITIGKLVDMVPISRRRILDRPGKNPRRSSSENICRVKIDLRCRVQPRGDNCHSRSVRAEVLDGFRYGWSALERSRETTSRYQCQSPAWSSTTRWMFRRPHGRELSRRIRLVRRDRSRDRGGLACISDRIQ